MCCESHSYADSLAVPPHGPSDITSSTFTSSSPAYLELRSNANHTHPYSIINTTTTMASRLLNPTLFSSHFRTPLFAAGLGISAAIFSSQLLHIHRQRYALRLDSSPSATSPKDWSFSQYQNEAQNPIVDKSGGLNGRAVRQMSAGSIIGNTTFTYTVLEVDKDGWLTRMCRVGCGIGIIDIF
jgi:hypothetical protein